MSAPATNQTIFALSSGRGRAGVAVIRVSGPESGLAVGRLTGAPPPAPRRVAYRAIRAAGGDDVIDRGLVLWFAGPASVTGEDIAEFHVHGGRAVVDGVLEQLAQIDGLRPAEAGEFTRRSFENGKMDLTEVEGLADLIAAETAAQRRQAVVQLEGGLAALYEGWRSRLVAALARVEAAIDFPDEDLPADADAGVADAMAKLARDIDAHLADGHRGERLRDGFQVVILGPPNAGKSTLLNALARRDAAIVSETAGTTRDVIEVHLDLRGLPVTVVDTAGLREGADAVEAEGVRRAESRAAKADLRVIVCDAREGMVLPASSEKWAGRDAVLAVNKIDLVPDMAAGRRPAAPGATVAFGLSARAGAGLSELVDYLADVAEARMAPAAAPALTRARHRHAVADCRDHLGRYLKGDGSPDPVLAAEDLRLAARALGRITGRVDVEDVLDVIFRDFCIGK